MHGNLMQVKYFIVLALKLSLAYCITGKGSGQMQYSDLFRFPTPLSIKVKTRWLPLESLTRIKNQAREVILTLHPTTS